METIPENYEFCAKVWLYHNPEKSSGSWHFVTLPKEESAQIKFFSARPKVGFGSVPVLARIGSTTWKTSVFPDKKSGAYILPIKADVRKKENIEADIFVTVSLQLNCC